MKCPICNAAIHREARNNSQNSLFHLWMRVLADEIGCDMESMKRSVKRHILGLHEVECVITGLIGQEDYKTSEMSKKGMAEFMTKIQAWADVDLGVVLPDQGTAAHDALIDHYKHK